MSQRVDLRLVERQRAETPNGPDPYVIAAGVDEDARRIGIENPNGMFVSRYRRALEEQRRGEESRAAAEPAELERYAEMHVQIYRLIALRNATPLDVARSLRGLVQAGFTRVNPRVIEKLQDLGNVWPEWPPLPEL